MDAHSQFTTHEPDWKAVSSRWGQAQMLDDAADFSFWWHSSRQVAHWLDVPDSSFRYCLKQHQLRCEQSSFPRQFVEFCDSPDGVEFLHRLLTALHLVFVLAHDCGLRSVGWFLQLSGLAEFLPPSYGAQQSFATQLETLLGQFGQQEDQRLAAEMPPREITVCEDETFHPQICLVAIEPVSNFLLLEQYASQRDAETWSQALDQRLASWSVTVCQVASDEAKALIAHAEQYLGAHHSPDLFHVQHETVQATSLMLANQTRHAHQAATEAQQLAAQRQQELAACQEQCPQSSHVAELQQQSATAVTEADQAQERLTTSQTRQQQACEARQGISGDYHPVDMETGEPLSSDEVQRRLDAHFDCLEQIADEAELSPRAKEKLAKARRVLPAMVGTITFFWATVAQRLAGWQLSIATATWLREQLIPGYYVQLSSAKGTTAAERHRRRELAETILARARSPDGIWGTLSEEERKDLEGKARDCASLFQRSSSCVEGRNGQLSLRHHGLHRLTPGKLGALRVLHNYVIERPDKTTAAERFFGQRPQPLLPWLLSRLPLPGRPRARRSTA